MTRTRTGRLRAAAAGQPARTSFRSARLKDAVELDAVRAGLTGVEQAALEPARVWMWTAERP